MRLYNTLSGRKEAVPRPKKRPLEMFVCGPTVYDDPHIGNARPYVTFDALARYLRALGYAVRYVQNITDIDDKIIARAEEENRSWKEVARQYEKVFRENVKALNVKSVGRYARATDYIPQIVAQVKTLIRKKHAYKIDGDGYYFDLTTFPAYGKLARRTVEAAEDGVSRIDVSNKKRNRGDFCLWKFSPTTGRPAEPSWSTKLGAGRPGWHIEDTAITERFFGPQYDIHGGGRDLIFPHHEAEIAQQESASGKKPFVKIWMHTGLITVNGKKMGKSFHNFVTVNELLKKFSPNAFRLMVLSHHYRSSMDYTEELMRANEDAYRGLLKFLARCALAGAGAKRGRADKSAGGSAAAIAPEIGKMAREFSAALEDDFNTPQALAALFSFVGDVNPRLFQLSREAAERVKKSVTERLAVLGFTVSFPKIPTSIARLVREREAFRRRRQFADSDRLRKQLDSLGYSVEDTPKGPFVWPENA